MNAKACALALDSKFDEAIEWEERALKNDAWAKDKDIDGGVLAPGRIAIWKRKELWLSPVKKP
ncbi:MAG: hypothetical protein QM811_00240 [Pirellulales bacterium]